MLDTAVLLLGRVQERSLLLQPVVTWLWAGRAWVMSICSRSALIPCAAKGERELGGSHHEMRDNDASSS